MVSEIWAPNERCVMKLNPTLFIVSLLFLGACSAGPVSDEAEEAQVAEREVERDLEPEAQGHVLEPAATPVHDGAEIYGRVCVTCHGKDGDGRGLEMELFGFGAPEAEWTNGPSVEGILMTLQDGIHETSMKPFPEYGEAARRAVANHVLELRESLTDEDETP